MVILNKEKITKVGFTVKVVYASTPEQEDHIDELIYYLLTDVLPHYVTDRDMEKLDLTVGSIHTKGINETFTYYNGTLREAFYIISSLQSIIAVIEAIQEETATAKHRTIFNRNVTMLEEYGFHFPFPLEQFIKQNNTPYSFTKYGKAANEYLV